MGPRVPVLTFALVTGALVCSPSESCKAEGEAWGSRKGRKTLGSTLQCLWGRYGLTTCQVRKSFRLEGVFGFFLSLLCHLQLRASCLPPQERR